MAWIFKKAPVRMRKRRHTGNAEQILERLRNYLDNENSVPVELLCGFWKDQQKAITYQELRVLVEQGYLDGVTARLWQQDYSRLVTERMPKIWGDAMIAGSVSQPVMDGALSSFSFNTQTPGVVEWIRSRGAYLVTNCTQVQKDAIALLLEDKIRENHTAEELARLIRPCIGLTRPQEAAVQKFYDNMVSTLRNDHPRMKEASIKARALDASTKYAERLHRQRAMTIAQTEMAHAYNYGADQGIRQAQAEGLIGKCEKMWRTSGDLNVCSECDKLDGTRVGMEERFFSGSARLYEETGLYPPLHPLCACAVEYIEVEPPKYVYNKENDPLREVLGPISESNPEEMERIIENAISHGVEIRDNSSGMAYSPGLKSGMPGQLLISRDDSLGAWLHEEQHMIDDMNDGWAGFAGLFDVDRRARMEYHAYKKEIDLARLLGRIDIVKRLIELCKAEILSFKGEWDEKQLE